MSYTDDEKLGFCKSVIYKYLQNIKTWTDFKNFVKNISTITLKNKLKQAYQNSIVENDNSITLHGIKKSNSQVMGSEIDNI